MMGLLGVEHVIPVLITGIQTATNASIRCDMDPGNKCRGDKEDRLELYLPCFSAQILSQTP